MNAKELFYARRFREEGLTLRQLGVAFQCTKQAIADALSRQPGRGGRLYLSPEEKLAARKRNAGNCYRRRVGLPTL